MPTFQWEGKWDNVNIHTAHSMDLKNLLLSSPMPPSLSSSEQPGCVRGASAEPRGGRPAKMVPRGRQSLRLPRGGSCPSSLRAGASGVVCRPETGGPAFCMQPLRTPASLRAARQEGRDEALCSAARACAPGGWEASRDQGKAGVAPRVAWSYLGCSGSPEPHPLWT